MIATVSKKNKIIPGTKSADYLTLLKGANNAKAKLGKGKDVLTATNVVGGTFDMGAGNDRVSISGGSSHLINSGSGSDSVTIKNSTGDQIHLGSGNDKLTMSNAKNATIFNDGTGKKTITGANSSTKLDLQGAVYQQKVKGKNLIITVYNDNREVVATFTFKNCAKKNRPRLVNGCNGFAATDEITIEEYTPLGNTDTTIPPGERAHEVDVVNPENWDCQQSYGIDPITDEVYTGLSGSSQDFCGTPAIDPIISDEVYSWSYSSSDSLTTSTQNIAHETSVVQPSQQNVYAPARETAVAQPVF